MNYSFETFVERTNAVQDADSLVNVLLTSLEQHGIDRMIFSLLSDHSDIGLSARLDHLRNYPEDWMAHYFANDYDKIDPVVRCCHQEDAGFTWEQMRQKMPLSPAQKNCLDLGQEAGLHNGICIPVRGLQKLAGFGLASSEKKDAWDGNVNVINAMCQHFYMVFLRLHKKERRYEDNIFTITLTEREREVLLWMSQGKSNSVIGDILNISADTVNFHVKNIYGKLQVNNRILACTKALGMGLITP